jgi:hypothetical protein
LDGHKNPLVETVSTGDGQYMKRCGKKRGRVPKKDGAAGADQKGRARIWGSGPSFGNSKQNVPRACYLKTSRVTVAVCFVLPLVPVTVMV